MIYLLYYLLIGIGWAFIVFLQKDVQEMLTEEKNISYVISLFILLWPLAMILGYLKQKNRKFQSREDARIQYKKELKELKENEKKNKIL